MVSNMFFLDVGKVTHRFPKTMGAHRNSPKHIFCNALPPISGAYQGTLPDAWKKSKCVTLAGLAGAWRSRRDLESCCSPASIWTKIDGTVLFTYIYSTNQPWVNVSYVDPMGSDHLIVPI